MSAPDDDCPRCRGFVIDEEVRHDAGTMRERKCLNCGWRPSLRDAIVADRQSRHQGADQARYVWLKQNGLCVKCTGGQVRAMPGSVVCERHRQRQIIYNARRLDQRQRRHDGI